jgi:predicted phosphodiesterase
MRIFAISDIHIDYERNARWLANISTREHVEDILILAGDVTDSLSLLDWCLHKLVSRFKRTLYVPGNHELWVVRDGREISSVQKFAKVVDVATGCGASMEAYQDEDVSIIPLLGWYDYSFGEPTVELRSIWMDYYACRWPLAFGAKEVSSYFDTFNDKWVADRRETTITFSHFLPRIDLMPAEIPQDKRLLYPILGSVRLDRQLRRLNSNIHIYGHSHVNRRMVVDGVLYINNAFGYPHEARISAKRMLCIHTT